MSSKSFDCHDCGTNIPGTNCAFTLSREMGWRNKESCYSHCPCGYPVRSKDMRKNIFTGLIDNDQKATEDAFIYCETETGGGHVYYGTYSTCTTGNGTTASMMSSCAIFERYSGSQ